MKNIYIILIALFILPFSVQGQKLSKHKKEIINSIEKHSDKLIAISDSIWAYAETAFNDEDSSKLLSDYAESQGFKVTKGVAGMPTAFVATYGSGSPVISVLGEFDALPGIFQKVSPVKEALNEGAAILANVDYKISLISGIY